MAKRGRVLLKFILILLALILVIIVAALSRNSVFPAYVSLFYANGVNKTFDNVFSSTNKQLSSYGIYMKSGEATCHNGISDGGDVDYHYLSATVPCQRSAVSNTIKLSTKTINQITQLLLGSGWKQGNPPLPSLVATAGTVTLSGGIAYRFTGKTYCVVGYNNDVTPYQVTEACERDVSFCGGDNG